MLCEEPIRWVPVNEIVSFMHVTGKENVYQGSEKYLIHIITMIMCIYSISSVYIHCVMVTHEALTFCCQDRCWKKSREVGFCCSGLEFMKNILEEMSWYAVYCVSWYDLKKQQYFNIIPPNPTLLCKCINLLMKHCTFTAK